jgi:hypothetical protein
MEFLSESDTGEYSVRPTYPYGKWSFYEQILNVPTYATFNPYDASLEVRRLQDDRYVLQSPNDQGRYWIPEIGLFLGGWHGTRLGITAEWLRWWDEAENLLLWSFEQTEQERQRAEQELARLRSLLSHQRPDLDPPA